MKVVRFSRTVDRVGVRDSNSRRVVRSATSGLSSPQRRFEVSLNASYEAPGVSSFRRESPRGSPPPRGNKKCSARGGVHLGFVVTDPPHDVSSLLVTSVPERGKGRGVESPGDDTFSLSRIFAPWAGPRHHGRKVLVSFSADYQFASTSECYLCVHGVGKGSP